MVVKVGPPDGWLKECICGSSQPNQYYILKLVKWSNILYTVDVVLADYSEYSVISWYHKCDHMYYMNVVFADHSEDSVIGQYHKCDYMYYMNVVLAMS